jgi:transposase-like protein
MTCCMQDTITAASISTRLGRFAAVKKLALLLETRPARWVRTDSANEHIPSCKRTRVKVLNQKKVSRWTSIICSKNNWSVIQSDLELRKQF